MAIDFSKYGVYKVGTVQPTTNNNVNLNNQALNNSLLNKTVQAQKNLADNNILNTKVLSNPITNKVAYETTDNQNNRLITDAKTGEQSILPNYTNTKSYYNQYLNYLNNNNNNNNNNNTNTESVANTNASTSSYYDSLMSAFMEQNEASRQQALDAIMQNLSTVKSTYKNQIQEVIDEYNNLVDQNEVAKDRARRSIKERQANRGQLDSGLGRQEQLDLDVGYDNQTSELNAAKLKAVNEIYDLIAQAEADANTNKASVNNTYANALLQYKLAQAS